MKSLLCFIVCFFFIHCLLAQEAEDTLRRITLSTVVISAHKMEEPSTSVAQQVELIPLRQIEQLSAPTMAEVLQGSGHVFIQKSQQGGGSPVIRGFEASRILLVVDDVRLNNLIYRSGHLQNIITVDRYSLERVEILFGPSSTVYGSDALGGVVHMRTKSPRFATGTDKFLFTGNTLLRYASANQGKTGHVDFTIGGKKFSSLTSFTFSDFDDLRMGKQEGVIDSVFGKRYYYVQRFGDKDSLVLNDDPYLQRFSGYWQYDVVQKFAYRQSEKVTHSLNLQLSNSSDIPRYDRLTDKGANDSGLRWAEWYYGPQLRTLIAYDLTATDLSGFFNRMNIGLNAQHVEESRHQRRFSSNNLDNRIEKVDVMGYYFGLQKSSAAHHLRIGAEGQFNTLKSTAFRKNIVTGQESPLDTRYPDGNNTMHHHGLYVTHTWNIHRKWILNDGGRFQISRLHSEFLNKDFFPFPFNETRQNNRAVTGNIGIIFLPDSQWKVSAMISSGFRVPNVDDLGKVFESTRGKIIVPNKDLKPERTYNGDFSVSKIFLNKIKWENHAFYTLFRNAIITDKFTFNGQDSILYDGVMSAVYANQNKRKAFLTGFSSVLMADISSRFSFFASVSYTYGRIQTDTGHVPLDHIPPIYGRTELSYTLSKWCLTFSVDYNGWKRLKDYYLQGEDNQQYATPEGMPAWYIFNIDAVWRVHSRWQLQAGCTNLLDTQYRLFASGINAPGRSIFAVLKFIW
jgi:hemoglobin/transferrin/lactoferrin receptor protein